MSMEAVTTFHSCKRDARSGIANRITVAGADRLLIKSLEGMVIEAGSTLPAPPKATMELEGKRLLDAAMAALLTSIRARIAREQQAQQLTPSSPVEGDDKEN